METDLDLTCGQPIITTPPPDPGVLIGRAPGIYQADDRWGRPVPRFLYVEPVVVSPEKWRAIQEYQASWTIPTVLVDAAKRSGNDYKAILADPEVKPLLDQIEAKMTSVSPVACTIHQFNGWNPHFKDWMRHTVVLGEPSLKKWSWWDRHVLYPASRIRAELATRWARLWWREESAT